MRTRALLVAATAAALGAPVAAQRVDLGAGLGALGLEGDVTAFELTAGGTRAVFALADPAGPALCSVTLASVPRLARLSPPGLVELDGASLTEDGSLVAFRALRAGETQHRLLVAPCDGSRAARELPLPAGPGDLRSFQLDPGATRAVFLFGLARREHLHSVDLDGREAPIELNQALDADREVTELALLGRGPGARVVYVADVLRNAWYELFSVPVERGLEPVRLNGDLALHGDVSAFVASPDGSRVAYLAEQNATDVVELFVRAADGAGQPIQLSPPPIPAGDVRLARFTPDGRTLVFLADLATDEAFELHAAPADGSAPAVKLSGPLVAGGDVRDFTFAGERGVLYLADQEAPGLVELFAVDADGTTAPRRLNAPLAAGGVVWAEAARRDRLVLYAADASEPGRFELFAASGGSAGAPARALAPGLALALGDGAPACVPASAGPWLFLRARRAGASSVALFVVPSSGPGKPILVDGAPSDAPGAGVREVRLTSDDARLVYRAALDGSGLTGLYLRLLRRR